MKNFNTYNLNIFCKFYIISQYQPKYESETLRHLQNLPTQIITEQSLMQILSDKITHLNIANHTWISIEMIGQLGYMSPNIQHLNLSQTLINDAVLEEIGKSCKALINIDLSKCLNLTSEGISKFLKIKTNLQRSFIFNHFYQIIFLIEIIFIHFTIKFLFYK